MVWQFQTSLSTFDWMDLSGVHQGGVGIGNGVRMNPTETKPAEAGRANQAVLPTNRGVPRPPRTEAPITAGAATAAVPAPSPRRNFYGLPCAKCKTYYAAELPACPVCHASERVSPRESADANLSAAVEATPDAATLDEERERFLRSFKAQLQVSKLEINPVETHNCNRVLNHPSGELETAAVCQGCYDQLVERVDVMEAALHMDLQEATSVVYEAVWADPSDPGKTYQNAAQALLNELRRRAGLNLVLGPLQPLPH